MLRKIYDYTLKLAEKPHALLALFAISFIESSFFPIPPDILIVPLVLATPKKWMKIALTCTVASVLGAFLGYAIGYFAYEGIAKPILTTYGYLTQFEKFQGWYNTHGTWIVAAAGFTPFPYKVITIASGAVSLNLFVFTIASIVSRGARFFFLSWLLYKFGPKIKPFLEKHLGLLTALFFLLIFLGFYVLKGL